MALADTLELLRRVALSPDCTNMNRSTVKGFLGELLVKQRLESEGMAVDHLGNQTGFDLRYSRNTGPVQIDVKLSLPKSESVYPFPYWSWALLHENKKKSVSATHFVCVACD